MAALETESTQWRVVEAQFVTSAASLEQCPVSPYIELAIAGRSNVGKSSLINMLCNQKNLAKTSSTPGKTRLINFFQLRIEPNNLIFHLVDLPGYGYAKVSKAEQQEWAYKLQEYMENRQALSGVIHLVDSRHNPTQQDKQMRSWILHSGLPSITVLTKEDKLKASQREKSIQTIQKELIIQNQNELVITSVLKKSGINELTEAIVGLVQSSENNS